jgi:hypothetical protein
MCPSAAGYLFKQSVPKILQIVELIDEKLNTKRSSSGGCILCCVQATKKPFILGISWKSPLALVQ